MPTEILSAGGNAWVHPDLGQLLAPIDEIRPHPSNPRNGDTDAIVESIRVNGMYRPVYAQRSTGYVLAGNHTYAAMAELGATEIPIVWLDVDDVEAARVMVVDNRAADLGSYDDALLLQVLTELRDGDGGLLGTGFDNDGLDDLAALLDEAKHIDLSDPTGLQWKPNGEEYAQRYEEMGRRMVVLDYPKPEYAIVTAMLAGLRKRYDLDNNSEAVRRLLDEQPDLAEIAEQARTQVPEAADA